MGSTFRAVRPMSYSEIELSATHIRKLLRIEPDARVQMVQLIEIVLDEVLPDYLFQVLPDEDMPGMDGRMTLEHIKKNEFWKKIPVVILTTSDDERDVKACYELGANTYVQKPVDFDGLISAIKQLKEYWFEIALLPKECKHD